MQQLAKGETLFRQGEVSNSIYVIKEGCFKLLRVSPDGDETILQLVGPGGLSAKRRCFVLIKCNWQRRLGYLQAVAVSGKVGYRFTGEAKVQDAEVVLAIHQVDTLL